MNIDLADLRSLKQFADLHTLVAPKRRFVYQVEKDLFAFGAEPATAEHFARLVYVGKQSQN